MNIEKKLEEFKITFLPKDWIWRKGQKEAILSIIEIYQEGKIRTVILDSPVGSGKSVTGMAVSWILNQLGKKGFILASDISLQEQYEKDFKKFNIHWGTVKVLDHYVCIDYL